MTNAALEHSTSVSQLLSSLFDVPPNTYVKGSRVGNLMVLDSNGTYIGYLDIRGDGRYHSLEGEEEGVESA